MITLSDLRSVGVITDKNIVGYEDMKTDLAGAVLMNILTKVNTFEFKSKPRLALASFKAERGPTVDVRLDDLAIAIIEDHIKKIESLLDH